MSKIDYAYEVLEKIEVMNGLEPFIFKLATNDEIFNLLIELNQNLVSDNIILNNSMFDFYANSSLSGGKFPCAQLDCRKNNLESLSRFGLLYSDSLHITTPFEKHLSSSELDRNEIYVDLKLLLLIKPLVKSKIITIESEYVCLCSECSKKYFVQKNTFSENVNLLMKESIDRLRNTIKCKLAVEDGEPCIYISNINDFSSHEIVLHFKYYIPEIIEDLLSSKVHSKKLNINEMENCGIIEMFYNEILKDLYISSLWRDVNSKTYLTNRQIDLQILDAIFMKETPNTHNQNIYNFINHSLPIIDGVSFEKIIKLRSQDGESFKVYRDNINKYLKTDKLLTKEELKDIYSDIILPDINKIEQTLKINRKNLFKDTVYDIGSTIALITAGYYSKKLFEFDLSTLSSTFGTIKIADTMRKFVVPKNDLGNAYYFLYKVHKKNSKKKKFRF